MDMRCAATVKTKVVIAIPYMFRRCCLWVKSLSPVRTVLGKTQSTERTGFSTTILLNMVIVVCIFVRAHACKRMHTDRPIGPFMVRVKSGGYATDPNTPGADIDFGVAFYVNRYPLPVRPSSGVNICVVSREGALVDFKTFDTYADVAAVRSMVAFIHKISSGREV